MDGIRQFRVRATGREDEIKGDEPNGQDLSEMGRMYCRPALPRQPKSGH